MFSKSTSLSGILIAGTMARIEADYDGPRVKRLIAGGGREDEE